jgi:hypothetical protein
MIREAFIELLLLMQYSGNVALRYDMFKVELHLD